MRQWAVDFIAFLIFFGLFCFVLFCVLDLLRFVTGIVFERQARLRDAQEAHRRFQEWQATLDYPLGSADPTAPRDDDDGLSPLVEIWRRD
jgi:hypothetical protein